VNSSVFRPLPLAATDADPPAVCEGIISAFLPSSRARRAALDLLTRVGSTRSGLLLLSLTHPLRSLWIRHHLVLHHPDVARVDALAQRGGARARRPPSRDRAPRPGPREDDDQGRLQGYCQPVHLGLHARLRLHQCASSTSRSRRRRRRRLPSLTRPLPAGHRPGHLALPPDHHRRPRQVLDDRSPTALGPALHRQRRLGRRRLVHLLENQASRPVHRLVSRPLVRPLSLFSSRSSCASPEAACTRARGPSLTLSICSIVGYIMFLASDNPKVLYGASFLTFTGALPCGPFFLAWATANAGGPTARAVTAAIVPAWGSWGSMACTWLYLYVVLLGSVGVVGGWTAALDARDRLLTLLLSLPSSALSARSTSLATSRATRSTSRAALAPASSPSASPSTASGRTGSATPGAATTASRDSRPSSSATSATVTRRTASSSSRATSASTVERGGGGGGCSFSGSSRRRLRPLDTCSLLFR